MAALTKYFPLALLLLVLILVALFRNYRQPLITFLVLPLSVTGVVFGRWLQVLSSGSSVLPLAGVVGDDYKKCYCVAG